MLEKFLFFKLISKILRKKGNIVLITDNNIKTIGNVAKNIDNTSRALNLLKLIKEEETHGD